MVGLLSAKDYAGYADEGRRLAVDVPNVTPMDAARFIAEATPIIGDAMAAKEIYDEATSENPNWALVGALGGATVLGLFPGIGDAAAKAVKSGARGLLDTAKRVEVDPNAMGSLLGNVRLKPKGNIQDIIQSKYPDVSIDLFGDSEKGYELSRIVVPKGSREQGTGTKVMEDILSLADAQGARVSLTPDSAFGGSKPRLKKFYKKFGFVDNKGSNKDFTTRNTMYRNPVAPTPSPAQEVAGLLSSGRADEVTDEMLGKLTPNDNMELFELYQSGATGMDLPMDEASRMARAKGAGFEGDLFHGTGADIVGVDKSRLGEKQNLLGKGFYQTTSQSRPDRYIPRETDPQTQERVFSQGGNVLPLMSKRVSEFDLTQPTGAENALNIGKVFEGADFDVEYRDNGDQVFIKSKSDPKKSVYIDSYQDGLATVQKLKDTFGRNNVTNILEEAGFSGLRAAEGFNKSTKVNYNPEDVRSRFARFDPRLSNLKNLSAGVALPGAGLLALQEMQKRANEEQQRQGLLQ